MKSDFKTKLIQHILNKKNGEKGFTLIELLVVIIIIGILAAIALPSFLNQANKARESEAKTYVGSINRAQQAYFLEKSAFSSNLSGLGLGIATQTGFYDYSVSGTPASFANALGQPNKPAIRAFTGLAWLGATSTGEGTTLAILCQTTVPAAGTSTASLAVIATGCATGMETIK